MAHKTVKAQLHTPDRHKFVNLPVRIDSDRFITVRIGNSGQTVSLKPDEARKLADTLHDRVDRIDLQNRQHKGK
ncbi:hypothetical protein [Corynebacterium coyleae]|uniref:hypothetical protein n=1 Tax=Corynebacterium coyleae TaxID=53374 RepID=UPI000C78FA55|nr:hypothetical protein [Corynebacterium coyleae]PLA27866.1 hypothetical protein CYJ45_07060 [Corynebacterium coyleae]